MQTEAVEAPSGRQFEIRQGELRAVLTEVGGGLRELALGDWQVLDGYGLDEMCSAGRGQLLMPWPNRLRDGRYRWEGQDLQVPLSEPAQGNAIHGLVRWAAWSCAAHSRNRVLLTHRLHPQPGYPFTLDLEAEYRLAGSGLTVTLRAANPGPAPLPFGAGAHPYLRLGEGVADGVELTVPAATYLPTDERQIPTGRCPVEGTEYDFRAARAVGATRLDIAFADLERSADGRARVELRQGGRRAALWQDGAFTHVMVFTGDSLAPSARRRSLGIEPMTCPPNALQTGEGVIRLEPGARWEASWGIEAG